MSLWTIQLLGQFQLKDAAGNTQSFRTQKTAKLLAFLTYFPRKIHSRDQLIGMLWPDAPPAKGRNSLRVSLHSLRQMFSVASGEAIVSHGDTVSLNTHQFVVDTWQVQTLLDQAQHCCHEHQRLKYLEQIVQRDYGLFLDQFDDVWIMPERQYWQTIYVDTLHQLVDGFLARAQLTAASAYGYLAVKADPYAEQAHIDLIKVHMAMGRPSAAQSQYLELKRLFQQELNLPISAVVRDMAKGFGLCDGTLTFL